MSTTTTDATPAFPRIAALEADLEQITEALSFNMGSAAQGFSAQDLQRITIPAGGGQQWAVQTLEGEKSYTSLVGVIVWVRDSRVYYAKAFGADGSGGPPDCASDDGVMGFGAPGGECAACPLNEFGSAGDGRSKACAEQKHLFFIHGNSILPEVVVIPPTSLRHIRQYLLQLVSNAVPYFKVVTAITLTKEKSAGGIAYSEARFQMVGRLTEPQHRMAHEFHKFIKNMVSSGRSRRQQLLPPGEEAAAKDEGAAASASQELPPADGEF